jgi:predicted peptidase
MLTKRFIFICVIIAYIFLIDFIFALANAPLVKCGQLELLSKAKISMISKQEIAAVAKEESTKHPIEGYLAHPATKDCFDAWGYRYTGGRYDNELIRFRLRQPPKIVAGKTYPLIVWFHGNGESGDDNERQLAHLQYTLPFLTGQESLDFFMLVTQCPSDNSSWSTSVSTDGKGDAPFTIAAEIFEQILNEFPIDKKRITTFGMCSGGVGSTMLIEKYPELISAAVYISATAPPKLLENVAIYAFNCTDDPNGAISGMRNYIKKINNAGGNAYLVEIKSAAHDAWTPALAKYKVIAWMIEQKKNSLLSPPAGAVIVELSWSKVCIYYGIPICCIIIFLTKRWVRLLRKRFIISTANENN